VPRVRMGCVSANEGVPQPCFVWPETLYSQLLIKLPHNSSCSPTSDLRQNLRGLILPSFDSAVSRYFCK
jgi:hypothetical protein